jgi:dienelactone hydrolase
MLLFFLNRNKPIQINESLDDAWNDTKARGGWIHTDRIVITGWSYGGYLFLMDSCQYPKFSRLPFQERRLPIDAL